MKVADVIEILSSLPPDEHLAIFWSAKSDFDYLNEEDGLVLTDDRWVDAVRTIEKGDWFGVQDQVSEIVWDYAQEPEEVAP